MQLMPTIDRNKHEVNLQRKREKNEKQRMRKVCRDIEN